MATILFWSGIFLIFYTYVGYPLILFFCNKLKNRSSYQHSQNYVATVTHIIAAYNEEKYIAQKLENCLSLTYPEDKIRTIIVTDGSSDNTVQIVKKYAQIDHFHSDIRKGKLHAIDRVIHCVKSEIVVFSDANSFLNSDAITSLVRPFQDDRVGVVSGEKVVLHQQNSIVRGEGFYWRYESILKTMESDFNSVVGAVGEIFAIRRQLYPKIDQNLIIEDFAISLLIAMSGYKIKYSNDATSSEKASLSMQDEIKRKNRISAGSAQAVFYFIDLINVFKYGLLSFQYISHKLFRWTLCPLFLPIIFISNIFLLDDGQTYKWIFLLQSVFYIFALLGYFFSRKNNTSLLFHFPYYFVMMHFSMYHGFSAYFFSTIDHSWEKVNR